MELESLRAYLLKKKGAFEDFPFGPEVMVFKVRGKMFALVVWAESPLRINLKCDPDLALHLREAYKAIQPGYHMNKTHWNTITLDNSIPGANGGQKRGGVEFTRFFFCVNRGYVGIGGRP